MGGRTSKGTAYYYCYKSQDFKAPINEKGEPQPCTCKWVNGRALEAAVWDTVTNLLWHPEAMMLELERLTQIDSATREMMAEELGRIEKRFQEFPKEERRLVEGYRKGFYTDFMMREETERLRQERDTAEERRRELQRQLSHLDKAQTYQARIQELSQGVSRGLDLMDFTQRREFLRLLVDEVVYYDGKVTIKTIIPSAVLFPPMRCDCILYPKRDGRKGFTAPSYGVPRGETPGGGLGDTPRHTLKGGRLGQ